jgi:hypothetical protein
MSQLADHRPDGGLAIERKAAEVIAQVSTPPGLSRW